MIFTHRITDDPRTLSERLIKGKSELSHIIESTALNGFKPVAHIGKCTGYDYAHRIIHIGSLHFLGIFCFDDLFFYLSHLLFLKIKYQDWHR